MEKIKLLVVDDIPQTRKDIIRLLYFEDDMIVVGEAVDGRDALKKIGEHQPDVVLMDINMPQMDGIAATERVSQLYPHVAVVIISIQGESEYLKKAMIAGARDYLVKPLGSDEMANTIRSVNKQVRMRLPGATQPIHAPLELPEPQQDWQAQPRERVQQPFAAPPEPKPFDQKTYGRQEYTSTGSQEKQPSYYTGDDYQSREQKIQPEASLQDRVQAMYRQQEEVAPPQKQMHDAGYHGMQHEQIRNTHEFRPIQPMPPQYRQAPAPQFQEYRQETAEKQQLFPGLPQAEYEHDSAMSPETDRRHQENELYGTYEQYYEAAAVDPKETKKQPASPLQLREQLKQSASALGPEPKNAVETGRQEAKESRAPQQAASDNTPFGIVKVVFCGKGGVGKTTIATNLAVVLAQQEKKKVALVDFDLQFGDISVLLNLADGKNISDLVQEADQITEELLENYMIRHFTGIDILPAPLFPQDAEYITAEHTDKILQLLKKGYDYIIVDTAGTFNEINLMAMDLADQILLVTTRDIVTIKNTKTSLDILESLNYREKIRVVLNRCDQDLGVEIADLEKGLEITVSHKVASDEKSVISSINKGVPVVVSFVNSELSKSFKRLSDRMINGSRHSTNVKGNKSIITRMFSL